MSGGAFPIHLSLLASEWVKKCAILLDNDIDNFLKKPSIVHPLFKLKNVNRATKSKHKYPLQCFHCIIVANRPAIMIRKEIPLKK